MLQWARANGCPWDEYTCTNAAQGGHLEMPQWARANGCPWDKRTLEWGKYSIELLKWAITNGCPQS